MKTKHAVAFLLLGLLACLHLPGLAQAPKRNTTLLEAEQLRQDFTLLRKSLEEAHPGLYRYTPKEVFDAKFDSTFALLNKPLTEQEFYKIVKPLITLIRCGHTKFMPAGGYNYWYHINQLFPLQLHVAENKAYILRSYLEGKAVPAGAELVSINGVSYQDVLQELLPYVSFADGMVQTSKYMELSKYFSGYYAAVVGDTPVYQITYKDSEGKTGTATYKGVTLERIKAHEARTNDLAANRPAFELTFEEDNIAVLRVAGFMNSDNQRFRKFMANAFKTMQARQIRALILDVRSNEGGMDGLAMLLSSYLASKPYTYFRKVISNSNKKYSFSDQAFEPWYYGYFRSRMKRNASGTFDVQPAKYLKTIQPQRYAFTGPTYILVNGWSYSATAEFAAAVHTMGNATFVGQETGGAYQGDNSGYFTILRLPNTNITLGIPLWSYYTAIENEPENGRGTIPHHIVAPTAQDILSGVDREMVYTLELIRRNTADSKAITK